MFKQATHIINNKIEPSYHDSMLKAMYTFENPTHRFYERLNDYFRPRGYYDFVDKHFPSKFSKGQDLLIKTLRTRSDMKSSYYVSIAQRELPKDNIFVSTHVIIDHITKYGHRYPLVYIFTMTLFVSITVFNFPIDSIISSILLGVATYGIFLGFYAFQRYRRLPPYEIDQLLKQVAQNEFFVKMNRNEQKWSNDMLLYYRNLDITSQLEHDAKNLMQERLRRQKMMAYHNECHEKLAFQVEYEKFLEGERLKYAKRSIEKAFSKKIDENIKKQMFKYGIDSLEQLPDGAFNKSDK